MKQTVFSADKDHTIMTGGTFTIDKSIYLKEAARLYLYYFTIGEFTNNAAFHKGIHSLEHCLAYSKDTGSIRAIVEEKLKVEGKLILDCSPYLYASEIGFRITSIIPLQLEVFKEIIETALQRTQLYLSAGKAVPFSTAKECGQYDFHSAEAALEIIDQLLIKGVSVKDVSTEATRQLHPSYYVADLRLLKPKEERRTDQYFLEPLTSQKIAQYLETHVVEELENKLTTIIVGAFGCMTGMYFLFSEDAQLQQPEEERYRKTIHRAIYANLKKMSEMASDEATKAGLLKSLENIQRHGEYAV